MDVFQVVREIAYQTAESRNHCVLYMLKIKLSETGMKDALSVSIKNQLPSSQGISGHHDFVHDLGDMASIELPKIGGLRTAGRGDSTDRDAREIVVEESHEILDTCMLLLDCPLQ